MEVVVLTLKNLWSQSGSLYCFTFCVFENLFEFISFLERKSCIVKVIKIALLTSKYDLQQRTLLRDRST